MDPIDGIEGYVRNVVYRAGMTGREVIKSPKEFAKCTQKLVKGIHCYYLPIEQVMEEAESIQNAPHSTDMHILQVHMARRRITMTGFHCVQLFHIASDEEAFHNQWYKRAAGTEPCGYYDTLDEDEIETTCAKCVTGENRSDWIKCPTCSKCYHDGCFYVC